MVVLVTGRDGQLGSEIELLSKNIRDYEFIFTNRDQLDISKESQVYSFFENNRIDKLINCAAYTNVDGAEIEAEKANEINNLGVSYLAKACKRHHVGMVHISTDYVFDGESDEPYKETDSPNPINTYGKSKLAGEIEMKRVNPKNSIIIRSSWIHSKLGDNFVKKIISLAKQEKEINVVCDQFGSPTNAADLAENILFILSAINSTQVDIFNFCNSGSCSWFDFALEIIKKNKYPINVNPISSNEYKAPAKRPKFSVLSNSKISKTFNLNIRKWNESLYELV